MSYTIQSNSTVMTDERTNNMVDELIGHKIVSVGVTNEGGVIYPIINLDNGIEICIQSDDEGNNGGTAVIRTETKTYYLTSRMFDGVEEDTAKVLT